MPDPQQESFLTGTWNVLEFLNENSDKTAALVRKLPYLNF